MQIEGARVRLRFDHADGLVAGGSMSKPEPGRPASELTEFTIAGEDRRFHPAQAKIDGECVVVWSEKVPEPRAVRFGWSDTAMPNLFNKAGLPASPFRTDDWPTSTQTARW
jgi:sialate O-acetylesterase